MSRTFWRRTMALVLVVTLIVGSAAQAGAQDPVNPVSPKDDGAEAARPLAVHAGRDGSGALTISWQTEAPVTGWVEYGLAPDRLDQRAWSSRGQGGADTQHQVVLDGAKPGTVYYYVIVSGGKRYDNAGSPFKVVPDSGPVVASPDLHAQIASTYRRIGIEAGHSPADAGAMSCDGRRRETDNTIAVAELVRHLLQNRLRERGYTIDIFRGGDTRMQGYRADAFVSLHNDYCVKDSNGRVVPVSGFKVSRYGGRAGSGTNGSGDASDRLVQAIWEHYRRVTGMAEDRSSGHYTLCMTHYYALNSVPNGLVGVRPPGQQCQLQPRSAWIAAETPGAIIEMGWWSGDEDMLVNHRDVLAAGVAESILAFLNLSGVDPDDGRAISSGQTLGGTIDPANDEDSYYFDANQGQRASIRMSRTSGNLDSYLILYGPNGNEVARDDDSGGNLNSWIDRAVLPQSGRYRILAKSYFGGSSGAYALSLGLTGGASDPDDGRMLSSGQNLGGAIDPANDEDNYYFDAGQGQRATIRMSRTGGNLDSYLILYAPNGSEVARDDDSGGNLNSWINRAPLPQGGRYRILAKSYYGRSSGTYNLSLGLESGSSGNLALNKPSWATSRESSAYSPRFGNDGNTGTRWSSQISSSLGWQWYKVDLGSAQTFNRFVVRWEAAYGAHYWVGWCDHNCTSDNSTWYGYERWLSSRQDDVIDFGSQTHRYVGILMIERAPRMNNYSLWEFEVYNRQGGAAAQATTGVERLPVVEASGQS
mgnify:CR=1 FL=1